MKVVTGPPLRSSDQNGETHAEAESVEVIYYYKNGDTVQAINGHQEKTGYQLFRLQN